MRPEEVSHRPPSVNLFSEDFIAGYMHDGRMSVVRRFFCLFVTFDLIFISLLWVICIVINGNNIKEALENQIIHYNVESSLFDIVMLATCRFVVLILFYALLYINHWIIVALSTSTSCGFLIYKVFVYNWQGTPQPVFEVLLVIISFVIAWGETWFLDCRVIPQERYANFIARSAMNANPRTPLLANFLPATNRYGPPESIHNFYSPFDSLHNSDEEEDQQDDEFRKLGIESVEKAYDYLESTGWKIEKVTSSEDIIQSTSKPIGKIYKLTGKVKYPAKLLLNELFYKIEEVPTWNPTLLESKILHKIDKYTDIAYSVSVAGGGGLVKSRDFVNLRCWQVFCDGKLVKDNEDNDVIVDLSEKSSEDLYHNSVETLQFDSDNDNNTTDKLLKKSNSEVNLNSSEKENITHISKSLGTHMTACSSTNFETASSSSGVLEKVFNNNSKSKRVYVSAAVSVDHVSAPPCAKYIRGQNIISCWAMRELDKESSDECIFEWLLCLDLKGSIPKYVLNTAYITLMQDYMTFLRKHVDELNKK